MLTFEEINALGDIIQKSWGKSSTGVSGSPQWVVNCQLVGENRLVSTYKTIVNMSHPAEMHQRSQKLEDEGLKIIKEYSDGTKKMFKEATGRALKLKMLDHHVDVEMISMSSYSPKRTSYFRVTAISEIE